MLHFAVPCGAGGHLAAGLLALQMGLPAKLIAATNANDALHRLLSEGVLHGRSAVAQTVSPSMDIQVRLRVGVGMRVRVGGGGGVGVGVVGVSPAR